MLDPLFHWWLFIYLFNNQLWEKVATIVQQGNTIPVAALLFIVWLVPTCGLNGTDTALNAVREVKWNKKIMNSGKEGRYEREREYSCALSLAFII